MEICAGGQDTALPYIRNTALMLAVPLISESPVNSLLDQTPGCTVMFVGNETRHVVYCTDLFLLTPCHTQPSNKTKSPLGQKMLHWSIWTRQGVSDPCTDVQVLPPSSGQTSPSVNGCRLLRGGASWLYIALFRQSAYHGRLYVLVLCSREDG